MGIERFNQPPAPGGSSEAVQKFSFAIAVKDISGEIFAANSEDREWSLTRKGLCVEARFYPFPPWNIERSGTYSNVRLTKITECPFGSQVRPGPLPSVEASPTAIPSPAKHQ